MGRNILCNKYKEKFLQVSNVRLFQEKKSVIMYRTKVQRLCIYSQLCFGSGYDLWQTISREPVKQKEGVHLYCDEEQINASSNIRVTILAHLAQYLFF